MHRIIAAAALAALVPLAPALAEGVARAELSRTDLTGVAGVEVVVARLTIQPGGTVPRHSHHGDEHLYVLEGGTLTAGNGKAIPFETGAVAHFPRGMVHGGLTNATDAPITVVTTHVVDKGKPLNVPAE